MFVNKILLKTAYKNNHLSILHTMSMDSIYCDFGGINVVRKDY